MQKRIVGVAVMFAVLFTLLYMRIYLIMTDEKYLEASENQSYRTVTVGTVDGNIYDRNFLKLVNQEYKSYAVINPTPQAVEYILPFVSDNMLGKLVFAVSFEH